MSQPLPSRPLAAKRILVTRARQQASALAEELETLGANVIRIPAIEIKPLASYDGLDAALHRVAEYDWLVFTSANAVAVFAARMTALQVEPSKNLRVAAIGPATANALREFGFADVLMPENSVAEGLAEALRNKVHGKRVLLVRAKLARDVLPESLRSFGASVKIADAYENVVPAESVQAIKAVFNDTAQCPHAITFTSSSTAQNIFALLTQAGIDSLPQETVLASIGPITSATLLELGYSATVEAEEASVAGLVRALVRALSGK